MTPRANFFCTVRGGSTFIRGHDEKANVPVMETGGLLPLWVRVPVPAMYPNYQLNGVRWQIRQISRLRFLKGRFMRKQTSGHWVYTARITLRNGKVIYAYEYGLKAFRIWVKD